MIEELSNHLGFSDGYKFNYADKIADFILTDRKRIVEPLVKMLYEGYLGGKESEKGKYQIAIEKTLKNAGVEL